MKYLKSMILKFTLNGQWDVCNVLQNTSFCQIVVKLATPVPPPLRVKLCSLHINFTGCLHTGVQTVTKIAQRNTQNTGKHFGK